jgi:hypothetical protein
MSTRWHFCCPPAVQADLAVQAAGHGSHVCTRSATSLMDDLPVDHAVADADVASIVFFHMAFYYPCAALLVPLWAGRATETGSLRLPPPAPTTPAPPTEIDFVAQRPACAYPYQRSAHSLTTVGV